MCVAHVWKGEKTRTRTLVCAGWKLVFSLSSYISLRPDRSAGAMILVDDADEMSPNSDVIRASLLSLPVELSPTNVWYRSCSLLLENNLMNSQLIHSENQERKIYSIHSRDVSSEENVSRGKFSPSNSPGTISSRRMLVNEFESSRGEGNTSSRDSSSPIKLSYCLERGSRTRSPSSASTVQTSTSLEEDQIATQVLIDLMVNLLLFSCRALEYLEVSPTRPGWWEILDQNAGTRPTNRCASILHEFFFVNLSLFLEYHCI